MADEAEHALRFLRTRKTQSHALFQEYVKLFADLLQTTREARTIDIAHRFGASYPKAIKNITRLKSFHYAVCYAGLSASGEKVAIPLK